MRKLIFIAPIKSILLSVIKKFEQSTEKSENKSAIFFKVLKKTYLILLKLEESVLKRNFRRTINLMKFLIDALQPTLKVSTAENDCNF